MRNDPFYRIDEYGLEEFRSIWDDLEKMNQACSGILYGASEFARDTLSGMYTLGFYAASPVLSFTHGGFNNAYQMHQSHISSFERAWDQTTSSLFSGADFSSSTFQSFRSGTNLAFTAASIATPTNFAKAESFLRFSGSVLKNSPTVNKVGRVLTPTKIKSYLSNAKSIRKNQIISDLESIGLKIKGKSPGGNFLDFQNKFGNTRVKIHPPDKATAYHHLHVYDKMGNPLNKYLEIVDRRSIDAHIPYGGK